MTRKAGSLQTGEDQTLIYWKAPLAGGRIRLARNAALFAHWTYWMGVTLYGFLEAADYFDTKEYEKLKDFSYKKMKEKENHDE